MSRGRLVVQLVGAFAVAAAITVFFVLPAEYRIDLTGFGTATGLTAISGPRETVVETRTDAPPEIARSSDVPFRTDTVTITVPPFSENFGSLEYKVTMNEGDTLVYSWSAPRELLYEFHGHTLATPENPDITVMNYRAETGTTSNGTLVAPMDGIHGWYFANSDLDRPVTVELKLSGFYRIEPGIIGREPPTP